MTTRSGCAFVDPSAGPLPPEQAYFSAATIPAARRRSAWSGAVASLCGPFVTEFGEGTFQGSIERREVGGYACARIMQTSRGLRRTSREIAQMDPACYYLVLHLAGRCSVFQAERSVVMRQGELVLVDSGRQSEFRFSGKSVQLTMHVPRPADTTQNKRLAALVACPLRGRSFLLLATLMQSAFDLPSDPGSPYDLAVRSAIAGLLSAAQICNETDEMTPANRMPPLLSLISEFIVNHLTDPELSPAGIAAALGISERQLHRTFEKSGLSVCRWIRRARLDRTARALRDVQYQHRTITDIAFSWGFNDAAHFSRAFRDAFDQTPRDYRAASCPVRPSAVLDRLQLN